LRLWQSDRLHRLFGLCATCVCCIGVLVARAHTTCIRVSLRLFCAGGFYAVSLRVLLDGFSVLALPNCVGGDGSQCERATGQMCDIKSNARLK